MTVIVRGAMRIAVTLYLAAILGCGSTPPDAPEKSLANATVDGSHAPVTAFVPPVPAGCAGATAYDVCFAFKDATPLAVHVTLSPGAPRGAVAVVRFHRASGERNGLDLDQLRFKVGDERELHLYFQVYPGAYRIEVGVDADGDADPDGASDLLGWSATSPDVAVLDEAGAAVVDVATSPIETSFTVASRK